MKQSIVYIGVRGDVLALDRQSGTTLWRTTLVGAQFVTMLLDGDRVLAATQGEMFCLDAASGQQLWHNKLPGMGRGLISIATSNGSVAVSLQAQHEAEEQNH